MSFNLLAIKDYSKMNETSTKHDILHMLCEQGDHLNLSAEMCYPEYVCGNEHLRRLAKQAT